jgi:hypothetical protein
MFMPPCNLLVLMGLLSISFKRMSGIEQLLYGVGRDDLELEIWDWEFGNLNLS